MTPEDREYVAGLIATAKAEILAQVNVNGNHLVDWVKGLSVEHQGIRQGVDLALSRISSLEANVAGEVPTADALVEAAIRRFSVPKGA